MFDVRISVLMMMSCRRQCCAAVELEAARAENISPPKRDEAGSSISWAGGIAENARLLLLVVVCLSRIVIIVPLAPSDDDHRTAAHVDQPALGQPQRGLRVSCTPPAVEAGA